MGLGRLASGTPGCERGRIESPSLASACCSSSSPSISSSSFPPSMGPLRGLFPHPVPDRRVFRARCAAQRCRLRRVFRAGFAVPQSRLSGLRGAFSPQPTAFWRMASFVHTAVDHAWCTLAHLGAHAILLGNLLEFSEL